MKNLKTILISISLFIFCTVHAQTEYEWDAYGVGFELADDFEVLTDTGEAWELISSDDQIFISVMPWSDSNVTLADLEEATYWNAVDFVFGDGLDGQDLDGDCVEINDFDACYVIGAVYDNDWDYYLVALMMDRGSETNVQVAIAFNEGDEEEIVDMLNSFYAYD